MTPLPLLSLLAVLHGAPVADPAIEVAPGVRVLRGRFEPGAQPDGNTVVFQAPDGLVVVDTGRHGAHHQAILDLAARSRSRIAAVVNTHWHLDHVGGNPRVRRAFPAVRVLASRAIEEATTGFLATYRRQLQAAVSAEKDPAARKRFQDELAILDEGPALLPDEPVVESGPRTVAGLPLRIGLERHAVTAADLWILDPATGVLAAGDLVTLPVPLLDTACPAGWQAALRRLEAEPFQVLVPGHGPPMGRRQLEAYRAGFDQLLACAASERTAQACIDGWLRDLGALVPEGEREFAGTLLRYYVAEHLRAPGRTARLCSPRAAP